MQGGHQWAHGAGIVVLVPKARILVDEMGKEDEVAVVGAGGIVEWKGAVARLSLGEFVLILQNSTNRFRRFCSTEQEPSLRDFWYDKLKLTFSGV
jgi:nitronate monooxygenase